MSDLARVCLAISSFRNDGTVLELLAKQGAALASFGRVLVVDSLGTGSFPAELAKLSLPCAIEYHCFESNLGSAGNLAQRLALAAAGPGDFVYAVNHDGDLQLDAIAQLVRLAHSVAGELGAIYPLRRMTQRRGAFDVTGRFRFPFTALRSMTPPRQALSPVYWSSSNGALYALTPIRRGLLPFAELWMGFEDLAYGWLLRSHGYEQLVARDVRVDDGYEYRKVGASHVIDKPSWYAYYYARNMLLVPWLTQQPLWVHGLAWLRVLLELLVTLLLRTDKKARLLATVEGMADGARHVRGKWHLP